MLEKLLSLLIHVKAGAVSGVVLLGAAGALVSVSAQNGVTTITITQASPSPSASASPVRPAPASLEPGGWLRSGDIVDIMDNGEITVVDRKKAIIITAGGKNIAPSEIENALKDSEFIKEAIVVGEARKYLGAIIQVDYDTVGRWARDKALAYTNYKSLAQLPEVHELVRYR
jgi:acyl-CoA synthetase (AMP-forming)/AMP-acid ligase II